MFDLPSTLFCVFPKLTAAGKVIDPAAASFEVEGQLVFKRPHFNQLCKYLFRNQMIRVGVWSCLDGEQTKLMAAKLFGLYYAKLDFISASGMEPGLSPRSMARNLHVLTAKMPEMTTQNTLILSTLENQLPDFRKNDLLLPAFGQSYDSMGSDTSLLSLQKLLEGLQEAIRKDGVVDLRPLVAGLMFRHIDKRMLNSHRPVEYI